LNLLISQAVASSVLREYWFNETVRPL